MIKSDIIIIGAGPCGLFAVFEAGLLKMRCHLIDYLPQPGGQCSEIYPKKPIYDIPGFPEILAGELVDNLMTQIEPFKPGFTLGERVEQIVKEDDGFFYVTTNLGTRHRSKVVVIAAGLGCFEPRKPNVENLHFFESKGVDYIIKDPQKYKNKKVVISGGGDSALDWAIYLANGVAASTTLVHRRETFRGHPESVEKINNMTQKGQINLITNSEIVGLQGSNSLQTLNIKKNLEEEIIHLNTDYWIPLFGLTPKLGPIANWGLNLDKNAINVNTQDYSTNIEGVYAIGDINTYPGKLKLILSGFHEAALMAHSAFKHVFPEGKQSFKYTTVLGKIEGF
jgi:thioredoxin reductase (NADPH)